MNLVLLSRRAQSAGRLFFAFWLFGSTLNSELKRAGGRAACPLARAPLRSNVVGLPRRGVRGEVGRTKLFTMTLCGRYPNRLWFCSRAWIALSNLLATSFVI